MFVHDSNNVSQCKEEKYSLFFENQPIIISGQLMMGFQECLRILRRRLPGIPCGQTYQHGWRSWSVFFFIIISSLWAFLADKNGLSFVAAEASSGWSL